MAGVFLSYDRDDGAAAKVVATGLEKSGHSVWWDLHVRGGAKFTKVIEEALKAADVVVVLWSANSVESAWVCDEASAGRDSGRLVPAALDKTLPPLGFRQFQTIDLGDWKRGAKSGGYKELESAIAEMAPKNSPRDVAADEKPRRHVPRIMGAAIGLPAIAAIAAAAYFFWPSSSHTLRTVTVVPASSSTMSRSLADDLFVKLGSLQGSNEQALQLVQQAKDPDLLLQVNGARDASQATATLALLNARDRSLLWSSDFKQPLARFSDLNQQLAYGAAEILECAADAFSASLNVLDPETRKLYLNACGSFGSLSNTDPQSLLPMFLEVTRRAPKFESGWRNLIVVEDDILFSPSPYATPEGLDVQLKQHIAAARRINPDLAEAYLAESDFVPGFAFGERMRLLDRAIKRNPNSVAALSARSSALLEVGRSIEGVRDARRAAQLSPFSSTIQDAYIAALTYSGQFDLAMEELAKAERLWPGASNIAEAKYRFLLRYGSPTEALRMESANDTLGGVHASFLKARADPTPANIEQAIADARRRYEQIPEFISNYSQTLAAFGKLDELYSILVNWQRKDLVRYVTDVVFRPAFDEFWRNPRSMRVAARLGVLQYWKSSGQWPDFCNDPRLKYNCKTEAAKLS